MGDVAGTATLSLLASLVLLDLGAAEHGDANALEWVERATPERDVRRTRLGSLRDIFAATRHGAEPVYETPIASQERLDDAEFYARIKSIDHDLKTFTLVVDLREDDDPGAIKDWAAESEQSIADLLNTGWTKLSPPRQEWFRTEIKPFLMQMERLDEGDPGADANRALA